MPQRACCLLARDEALAHPSGLTKCFAGNITPRTLIRGLPIEPCGPFFYSLAQGRQDGATAAEGC